MFAIVGCLADLPQPRTQRLLWRQPRHIDVAGLLRDARIASIFARDGSVIVRPLNMRYNDP